MFIVFEGIDGAGKSTQISLLEAYLRAKTTKDIILTREPGGTKVAEQIRTLLFTQDIDDRLTELFLYIAARRENFLKTIKSPIEEQSIVICDRFIYSTIAYQGYGFGIDIKTIEQLNSLIIPQKYCPTVTFILDVEVESAISRSIGQKKYESTLDIHFYEKVRSGFVELSKREHSYLIDANKDPEDVHNEILDIVVTYL